MENYQNKNKDKGNYLWLGVFAGVVVTVWALTTKNEVVEGLVFPLKVKLGLAQQNKNRIFRSREGRNKNEYNDRLKAEAAMEKLSNEILESNHFPDVLGVGLIQENNKHILEVALLLGEDHTKIKEYIPLNTFSGIPVKFVESDPIEAQ